MEFIYSYKNIDYLRESFNELSQNIFGINFEEWYEKGLWNNKYEPYSIKDKGKIIANISVNKFYFLIDGEKRSALQISTFMTKENYRGMGLAKKLMLFILEEFEKDYDIIYLFANNSVSGFYPRFGFNRMKQYQLYTTEKILKNNKYTFKKLDMNNIDDISILKNLGINRIPNSNNFDVIHGYEVMFWYCLNVFRENIFYNESEEVIIIYTIDENKLNIHDIISKEKKIIKKL